jgi:hypothetical protein
VTGFRRPQGWLGIGAAGAVLFPLTVAGAGEEKVCVIDGRLSVADAVDGCRPGDVVSGSFVGGVGAEGPAAAYAARICDFGRQVVLQPLPAGLQPVQGGDVALACVYLGRVRDERATK